jgi:putative flippase GtrA
MIIDKTIIKFVSVGIANTIVGATIMCILSNCFSMGYWISSAANYVFGSILSFFLNKYWTFNVRKWSVFMVIAFAINIFI